MLVCARIFCLFVLFLAVNAKVFTRCQLTRELLKYGFPRTFISNWVCLVEKESDKNTSALHEKSPKKKYYGLFQIGNEYCKEGKQGGLCDITCESLLDEDIKNDLPCALKVFETQGFKYWSKWESRCKGQTLPDIENHSALLDEDIKNDLPCALKVFETQGFEYWSKWESRCKGQTLPDIEKCPDWQMPPARASPPRDKRTIIRGKRDLRKYIRKIHKTRK